MNNKQEKNKPSLKVNKGIDQPSSLNEEAAEKFRQKKSLNTDQEFYIEGILEKNRSILSQAITLVESTLPDHYQLAQGIIESCLPYSGNSVRVGITGVPGVGKSTFIEALGKFLTSRGHKLAVLAIDPSSKRSKGSILGDKTRMEELAADPNAFIRPSPSAGTLGGVARKTKESIILCEAAGFDIIFVETVGVGQSETAVHSMVDFFLLLMLAGAGDELQGIKRGIMEMADAIVINKADGDNMGNAMRAKKEFENALHLYPPTISGWIPKVEICSALNNSGIDNIWEIILNHNHFHKENGYFQKRRLEQNKKIMHDVILEKLENNFLNNTVVINLLEKYEKAIDKNQLSSYVAAQEILNAYFDSLKDPKK